MGGVVGGGGGVQALVGSMLNPDVGLSKFWLIGLYVGIPRLGCIPMGWHGLYIGGVGGVEDLPVSITLRIVKI